MSCECQEKTCALWIDKQRQISTARFPEEPPMPPKYEDTSSCAIKLIAEKGE